MLNNNNFLLGFLLFFICLEQKLIYSLVKKYNFCDQQNYEIDLLYPHIPGTNMYFFSKDNSSLLIINVNTATNLFISFKLYTSETDFIQKAQTSGIYMGLDFKINSTDTTKPNITSDALICFLKNEEVQCGDYAYLNNTNEYVLNSNGELLKSKIYIITL